MPHSLPSTVGILWPSDFDGNDDLVLLYMYVVTLTAWAFTILFVLRCLSPIPPTPCTVRYQTYFEVGQICMSACSALDHLTKNALFCGGTEMQCWNVLRRVRQFVIILLETFDRAGSVVLKLSAKRPRGQCGRLSPGGMRSSWTLPVCGVEEFFW